MLHVVAGYLLLSGCLLWSGGCSLLPCKVDLTRVLADLFQHWCKAWLTEEELNEILVATVLLGQLDVLVFELVCLLDLDSDLSFKL